MVADRQTHANTHRDRQTDRQTLITIPRFAIVDGETS